MSSSASAILAGDVLQTLAFKVIAEDEKLSPDIRIRLIALIATASGSPGPGTSARCSFGRMLSTGPVIVLLPSDTTA